MVDVASDWTYGMWGGDRFRTSQERLEDVKKVIVAGKPVPDRIGPSQHKNFAVRKTG
jgi:hypothetical protein